MNYLVYKTMKQVNFGGKKWTWQHGYLIKMIDPSYFCFFSSWWSYCPWSCIRDPHLHEGDVEAGRTIQLCRRASVHCPIQRPPTEWNHHLWVRFCFIILYDCIFTSKWNSKKKNQQVLMTSLNKFTLKKLTFQKVFTFFFLNNIYRIVFSAFLDQRLLSFTQNRI